MLVDNDWLLNKKLSVILSSSAFGTGNSEDTVDVAVCSCVKMFFNRIVIVHDHLHQRLVLILLGSQSVYSLRNPSCKTLDVLIDIKCKIFYAFIEAI